MKRVFYLISFSLIVLFLFTTTVFADMDAPRVMEFTVEVENPNGISYFNSPWSDDFHVIGTFPYGTKLTVQFDNFDGPDGKIYYSIRTEDDEIAYIREKDVKTVIKTELDTHYDSSKKIDLTIVTRKGVEMYLGPGENYAKADVTIPFMTELVGYEPADEEEYMGLPWYFVTYNGVQGWICELEATIGYKSDYIDRIITPVNIYIYADSRLEEKIGAIPANTIINENILTVDAWSRKFFINYEGVSGYINAYSTAIEIDPEWTSDYDINYNGAKLYKEATTNAEIIADVPNGTVVTPIYIQYDYRGAGWIYTKYDGDEGWIYTFEFEDGYNDYGIEEFFDIADLDEKFENKEVVATKDVNTVTVGEFLNSVSRSEDATNVSKLSDVTLTNILFAVIIALLVIIIIILLNKNKNNDLKNEVKKDDNE